jgi:hypothetical protein
MKKLVALVVVGVLSVVGFAHSEIVDSQDIEGYWFGDAYNNKASGMVLCDNRNGVAYLGFYSSQKIPNFRKAQACNLAFSMNSGGQANMQVVDPADGHIYNLDLLALAKNNQPKEVEETEEVEAESIEVLKAKNAELEKRIEELVAELIAVESKRGQE